MILPVDWHNSPYPGNTVEEAVEGYNRDVIRGAADVIEKMDVNGIVKENVGKLKALPSGKKD